MLVVTFTFAVRRSFTLAANAVFVTISVPVFSGRRMAVVVVAAAAASPVANCAVAPVPPAVVSTMAQGRMPCVVVPVAPTTEPLKVNPAVSRMVATPGPTAVPRLLPRKSTLAPLGAVAEFWAGATLVAMALKVTLVCWAGSAVSVTML